MAGEPFVVGRARHADHGGPGAPGQLDRDRADPARRPGHDHRVALRQRDRPHRRVGGETGHRQGPGHLPRHGGRLRRQVGGLDQDVLGLAGPVVGEADDLVAGGESGHVRARLGHDPGQVAALAGREHRRPSGVQQPLADLGLAGVDPCRLDLDQDMARARHRPGDVHHLQDVDPAVLLEPHCLRHRHSVLPASPPGVGVTAACRQLCPRPGTGGRPAAPAGGAARGRGGRDQRQPGGGLDLASRR